MPLTPADIHNMEFGKASLSRRGYDAEQVDSLLDEVSHEMIKLLEENEVLRDRVRRSDGPAPAAGPNPVEAELSAAAAALDRANRACDQAEQTARRLSHELDQARQSRQAAAHAAPPAAAEGTDRVLAIAQRTADDHLRDAEQESQDLIADARRRSARITGEARDLARDLTQQADRHDSEAKTGLEARRTALLREIDELTRFAIDYRAALESRMARQRQHLDGIPEPARD